MESQIFNYQIKSLKSDMNQLKSKMNNRAKKVDSLEKITDIKSRIMLLSAGFEIAPKHMKKPIDL